MLLEQIHDPSDVRKLNDEQARLLCRELRTSLLKQVSRTGGHLASNLGVVELTVAIHRVFDTSQDRLVFDVGHQCYTHKLLTGRREGFEKLRKYGGISGFPKPSESEADAFIAGHASNSVSVALGMTRARTRLGGDYDVVAVIGDGALTGGLAYEGLSNAGQSGEPLVVILNDNAMSIGSNVGGMARLLSRMRVKPGYFAFKRWYRSTVGQVKPVYDIAHRVKEGVKGAILPENMFDDLGFYYLGPIDGHDVAALESAIAWARDMRVPVLLHVITQKGRGCSFAEADPEKYHGVGPFDPVTGAIKKGAESFSAAVGAALCREAERDERVAALTAAMAEGTGLARFARRFPERFFDTGIAEGHTVSMAAGMAKQGMLPVACVYSSFLQRGFDMLIHDVALLHLHVVFGVDRAGLVGEDGETHHGVFDIAYLGAVPGMTVWCPASLREAADMLHQALYGETGPVALRYPRGSEGEYTDGGADAFKVLREGTDVTIAAYGTMINEAAKAAESLAAEGVSAKVVKLGRVLPLNAEPVLAAARETGRLVVAEEVCASGCIGGRILASAGGEAGFKCRLLNLGEGIVGQGGTDKLRSLAGIDAAGIAAAAKELMA
ncbi:MAG: 1-deoxy-D-xylulose-5-phosphate synthase [Firmicutes bacterium]|nr:1-deoxy-D-xylulose-5-phosphate synthase [Bacillota bacterium]